MNRKIISVMSILLALTVVITICAYAAPKKKIEFITPDSTALDLDSGRYTQLENKTGEPVNNRLSDLSNYVQVVENENYALYYNDADCNLRVLNKKTGYVWGGVPTDGREDLNDQWSELADSIVTIGCLNSDCMTTQISMKNSKFQHSYTVDGNVMHFDVSSDDLGIAFKFNVTLYEDSIEVSMVKNSLEESGDYLLQYLYFMPFFGATRSNEIDGYMFVPDGSGALIRYRETTKYLFAFEKKVYGLDMAIDTLSNSNDLLAKRTNDYLTDEKQVTAPVFGVAHGVENEAFLAVINGGDDFASIYACPAGYIIGYNWVTARFDYRTVYSKAIKKDGSGITVNQETPNKMTPSVRYYFLQSEQADYTGMAVKYRELLINEGTLKQNSEGYDDIPVRIEAIAADINTNKLFNSYTKMTDISEANNICTSLNESGISNINFIYKGWTKGGLNGGKYGNVTLDSRLGSLSELKELNEKLKSNNGKLSLWLNPFTANDDQCNSTSQATQTVSRRVAYFYRDNDNIAYPKSYVMKPPSVTETINKFYDTYKEFNLYANGVGNSIYGDYTTGEVITRDMTRKNFTKILGKYSNRLALSNPNAYLWGSVSDYFDLPLENSQYFYETDSVPFLSIVLKGTVNYYAPHINQGYYTDDSILKMIEYGAYPSFLVMAADNSELMGTPCEDYFSICFDNWETAISQTYDKMNEVLKAVEGAFINDHKVIATGVTKVDYSNGISICVNYNSEEYTLTEGSSVPAKGCLILGR